MAVLRSFRALSRRLETIGRRIEAGAAPASLKIAQIWRDNLIEALHEPKSGLMYGKHQASAPGEIPAAEGEADPGPTFEESIEITTTKTTAAVEVRARHAVDLEYGTVHMEPRPFVSETTRRARADMKKGILKEWRSIVKKF